MDKRNNSKRRNISKRRIESQIFSKLKKRFCSRRKAFSEHGANALAKVCVLSEKFSLEDVETPIPIDTSVED